MIYHKMNGQKFEIGTRKIGLVGMMKLEQKANLCVP